APPPLAGDLRVIPALTHLAVGHILGGVVCCVLVGFGNLDAAVVPSRTEEGPGCGVGDHRSVYYDAVVVESHDLRGNRHHPKTVGAFRHIVGSTETHLDLLRVRSGYAEGHTAIRTDTGVRRSGNVERRRLAIVGRQAQSASQQWQNQESHESSLN